VVQVIIWPKTVRFQRVLGKNCGGTPAAKPVSRYMLTIEQSRVEEKIIPLFTETTLDLRFPCGLLGFEQVKEFKLHAFSDLHPFLWLEAVNGDGLCFLVVPPSYVVESYQLELSDEDTAFLSLANPNDALVLNIATFHPDSSMTINLKGPIIYNRFTNVARQIVPKNASALSIKHPLGN
jgi:flagellar assembly factor FliW